MNSPNDLSFLPDDYVARRARARANRLCGSLLMVTILSVAGAFTYAQNSLAELKQEHAAVNEQFRQESDRLKRLDVLQKQQTELARRAKLAEALIEKTPRTEVLASVKAQLPANTSLVEVLLNSRAKAVVKTPDQILAEKQARKSAAKKGQTAEEAPAAKEYETTLKVVGMAYTDMQVAEYINNLGRSPYFEDVNLLVSREFLFQEQTVRRFEVDMKVRDKPKPSDEAQASQSGAQRSLATTEDQAR